MDTTLFLVIAIEFVLVTIRFLLIRFRLIPDIADVAEASMWIDYTYLDYYPEAAMMGFMPWVYIPSHYHSAPAPSPAAAAKVSEVATAKPSGALAEPVS